jgi:hypothetical protein
MLRNWDKLYRSSMPSMACGSKVLSFFYRYFSPHRAKNTTRDKICLFFTFGSTSEK